VVFPNASIPALNFYLTPATTGDMGLLTISTRPMMTIEVGAVVNRQRWNCATLGGCGGTFCVQRLT
jgi:hypothetical protein